MKILKCNCGKDILIDDKDYDKIKDITFYCSHTTGVQYRYPGTPHPSPIAELIIGSKPYMLIDHKNRDIHDNRSENLRHSTRAQNNSNRSKLCTNTSGYKGVTWNTREQKWKAQISINNKNKFLGNFETKEQAAIAYNKGASKYFGEFAYQNEISNTVNNNT